MTVKHKQWLLKQMPQQLVKLIHHPCTHEDSSSCNLELNGCLILSPVLCNQSWNSLDCMLLTGPQYSSESAQEILLCIRVVKAGREKPWGERESVCQRKYQSLNLRHFGFLHTLHDPSRSPLAWRQKSGRRGPQQHIDVTNDWFLPNSLK